MAFLSSSPKILKGAFVRFDPESPQGRIIVFQYNPEKIYRRLEAPAKGYFPPKSPRETITFTMALDATDDLEDPDQHQNTAEFGIYSSLSAIEMLLYPHSSKRACRSFLGIRWSTKANKQSLTLLVWGNKRIVPVHVTALHINEEMFDPILNPIQATIEVKMRVLNDSDLPRSHKGYDFWKSHIATKIAMAKVAYTDTSINNLTTSK